MDSYISIKQVCKTYGRGASASTVLNKLDLEVAQGERVALVGQSGCGKSTLMNVIAGIDTIDIKWAHRDVHDSYHGSSAQGALRVLEHI